MQPPSINGYYYFDTFINDYSRFKAIYFYKKKFELFCNFKFYEALVENQTNKKIRLYNAKMEGNISMMLLWIFVENMT